MEKAPQVSLRLSLIWVRYVLFSFHYDTFQFCIVSTTFVRSQEQVTWSTKLQVLLIMPCMVSWPWCQRLESPWAILEVSFWCAYDASGCLWYCEVSWICISDISVLLWLGKGLPFFFTTIPGAEKANGGIAKQVRWQFSDHFVRYCSILHSSVSYILWEYNLTLNICSNLIRQIHVDLQFSNCQIRASKFTSSWVPMENIWSLCM